MILVRLIDTWPVRRSEWMLAVITLGIGLVFLWVPTIWSLENYETMRRVMTPPQWAAMALLVGSVRTVSLWINGVWRPSPYARAAGAFLSCFLWLTLALGALFAPTYGVTVVIWPAFLAFDSLAVLDALRDGRQTPVIGARIAAGGS